MENGLLLAIIAIIVVAAYLFLSSPPPPVVPTAYKAPTVTAPYAAQPTAPSAAASVIPSAAPAPSNVNWKGHPYSTDGRCGPNFNNTACTGTACCSTFGWCGGKKGNADDWCGTFHANNGEYDALQP